MTDDSNGVCLGDGVKDKVIENINENLSDVFDLFLNSFFTIIKDKIPSAVQDIEKIFSNPEMKKDITTVWSNQLFEKGLIPKGYNGYLEGVYAGYVLAMMSLVDNKADEKLILSVRDDIRPNLTGQHYNDRSEFYEKYKSETYNWVETMERESDE